MKWYYVEAGQQMGPVDDGTLIGMAAGGQIAPDTLVWKEGMANWQPYSEVAPVAAPPVAGAGSPWRVSRTAGPPPAAAGGGEEAVCAECGQLFPVTETIRIGDSRVCANCKPTFVQKMREGLTVGTVSMRYAGFWIRFAAKLLDGFILGAVFGVFVVILGIATAFYFNPRNSSTPGSLNTMSAGFLIIILAFYGFAFLSRIIYPTFFVGRFGATPGKMICRLRVVDTNGGKIGYGRAFGRFWAEIVTGLTFTIGYIIAAFDDEKRALHDRICNTRVVYK